MNSFPRCQVCHQPFSLRGPVPFLLPCLHAVCETCVTSAAGGGISCSQCQRDINLAETQLQKDVVRQKEIFLLTVQHHPAQILCTHEDDGNQAVCWCQDCEDFMCENCQILHNSVKTAKRHTVQEITDLKLENMIRDKDDYCSIHPQYQLQSWDKTCQILICRKCKRENHVKHDVEDVEEAVEGNQKKLMQFLTDVQAGVDRHSSQIENTKRILQTSQEGCDILVEKVDNTFASFTAMIDQRKKKVLIDIQQHKEKQAKDLIAEKEMSEQSYNRCLVTAEYINKYSQYASMSSALALKDTVLTAAQACLSSSQTEDKEDLPLPTFSTVGFDKLKSNLSEFGQISKDNILTEHGSVDKDTQTKEDILTLELKKTEAKCEKMINQKLEDDKLNQTLQNRIDDLTRQKQKAERDSQSCKKTMKTLIEDLNRIEHGSTFSLKAVLSDDFIALLCIYFEFSEQKFNSNEVHINSERELINKPLPDPPHGDQRLEKYYGTSSTVPLPRCDSPQYFEVRTRVNIDKALTENALLLEIGLVREEEQDQHHYIGKRPHSYSLTVALCPTHSSICRRVCRHGEHVLCKSDTISNTPGTSATLHYGVVYDNSQCKLSFIDVSEMEVIGVVDNVDSTEPLWPMFGVYYPQWGTITMSLVVGNKIHMSETKRDVIMKTLGH